MSNSYYIVFAYFLPKHNSQFPLFAIYHPLRLLEISSSSEVKNERTKWLAREAQSSYTHNPGRHMKILLYFCYRIFDR